jgi:GntR family transcriptional regulator / MocR family aminotransferase
MSSLSPNLFLLSIVQLNRSSDQPIYAQLYRSLRYAILAGQLTADFRLPSTRDMAEILDVSRNTVLEAVNQLIAEGYLEARAGSGTYITNHLGEELLTTDFNQTLSPRYSHAGRTIARRGEMFAKSRYTARRQTNPKCVFTIGRPALEYFPFDLWARIVSRHYRTALPTEFDYSIPAHGGFLPLREAIADYLKTARAVHCTPEQVIICNGSQQAMYIASQILLDPGDKAWIENPGHTGTQWILRSAGAEIVPVPVDEDGLVVEEGIELASDARLACVTPSLQFPIGSTMHLKRRTELLTWAYRNDAWIIEDDYNHEFRYTGHPLMSLQGLDSAGRVIYVGTFSKSMFPSLRIGYAVVPPDLIKVFSAARVQMDIQTPTIQQLALNEFIRDGHLTRHIRRMRTIYSKRREHLLLYLDEHLGGIVTSGLAEAGMHLIGWLPENISDKQICVEAEKAEVEILPVSSLYLGEPRRNGLILGYAGAKEADLLEGVVKLKTILNQA